MAADGLVTPTNKDATPRLALRPREAAQGPWHLQAASLDADQSRGCSPPSSRTHGRVPGGCSSEVAGRSGAKERGRPMSNLPSSTIRSSSYQNPGSRGLHGGDSRFVECLFDPMDLLEIRLLPEKNRHFVKVSKITTLDDQLTRSNADGQNVYIGANPRRREDGKAKDIPLARCVFVDLDQMNPDEGLQRIEEAGLPAPTCTVASGHGIHAYWRLVEPMFDLEAWRATQKSLIALLGSDPAIHDPPRLMRVPGFTNHKDPVADCRVLDADPARRYEISELLVEDENLLLQSRQSRQSLTSDCSAYSACSVTSAYSVTSACSATVDEVIRLTLPPRLGTRKRFYPTTRTRVEVRGWARHADLHRTEADCQRMARSGAAQH